MVGISQSWTDNQNAYSRIYSRRPCLETWGGLADCSTLMHMFSMSLTGAGVLREEEGWRKPVEAWERQRRQHEPCRLSAGASRTGPGLRAARRLRRRPTPPPAPPFCAAGVPHLRTPTALLWGRNARGFRVVSVLVLCRA